MPSNELLLRTERLDLVATTLAHIEAELQDPNALGPLLGIAIPDEWPPGEYDRHALEFFHAQFLAGGPSHVGWYGWYGITRNAQGQRESLVAAAGYLGPPRDGSVEIGYSVIPSARRQGYATELVAALVKHAFEEPSVHQVIAHTTDANAASIEVLLRCGFERVGPGSEPQSIQFRTKRTPDAIQQPIRIVEDGSQYLGKRLLVGITYEDHEGELIRQEQFHGLIVEAGEGGIEIERADTGERTSLPPELMPASPGEYRLRSTGETVVDPDYVAQWVMKAPKPDGEDDPSA